jgi:hypothetical protein
MKKCLWLLLPLAGCAGSSGVVPVGPDTYALSEMRAPAAGGGPAARAAVLADGAAFCQRQGRSFELLEARPDGDPYTPYWPTAFDATFRCGGK